MTTKGKTKRKMRQLWVHPPLHQRIKVEASIRGISIEALAMQLLAYAGGPEQNQLSRLFQSDVL